MRAPTARGSEAESLGTPQPRYRVVGRLHKGGMGEILLADVVGPHGFGRRVVLKGLLGRLHHDPVSKALFLREARLMALLDHPNVVGVFDLPTINGRPYLAMELVRGRNLHQTIQMGRAQTPLPIRMRLHVVAEALRGLHYAHTLRDPSGQRLGLVHRDVSPGNILVSYFGEVKLTDFGIARFEGSRRFTAPKSIRGKARYVAPELVRGGDATVQSDIYSAGVVLAETLIEEALWTGNSVADILLAIVGEDREKTLDRILGRIPEVAGLRAALRGALAIDPRDRFGDGLQFAEIVEAVAARLGPRVTPTELGLAQRALFSGCPDVPEDDGFGRSGQPLPDLAPQPQAMVTVSTFVEPGLKPGPAPTPELVAPPLESPEGGFPDTLPMSADELRSVLESGSDIAPFEVPLSQPMLERASIEVQERPRIRAVAEAEESAVLPFADTLARARAAMIEKREALPPGMAWLPPERAVSEEEPAPTSEVTEAATVQAPVEPALWPRPVSMSMPPPLPRPQTRAVAELAAAVSSPAAWVQPIPNRGITAPSPRLRAPSTRYNPLTSPTIGILLGGVLAVAGGVIALLTGP